MGRRASKVDANQSAIVNALRKAGATVQPLHSVGDGCPDLLVGFRGANLLMECKDGSLVPSARKLRGPQIDWHQTWAGQVCVVNSPEEALDAMFNAPQEIPMAGWVM